MPPPFQKGPEEGLSLLPSQAQWDLAGAESWGLRRRWRRAGWRQERLPVGLRVV